MLLSRRPNYSLILLHNRRDTLINKPLYPLAAIRLRRIQVALRIGREAVDAVELPGLPPALAETREELQRVAQDHVDLRILAIGEIQVRLLRVARERDVPRGSRSQRLAVIERFLHERSVRLEDLDAVVDSIADVEQAIDREVRAVHRIAELLSGRRLRIVPPEVRVIRLVDIRAPVTFVLAGLRVEHDDTMVAVPVGDVDLVGFLVDERLRGQTKVRDVVAPLARPRLADLLQELAGAREL